MARTVESIFVLLPLSEDKFSNSISGTFTPISASNSRKIILSLYKGIWKVNLRVLNTQRLLIFKARRLSFVSSLLSFPFRVVCCSQTAVGLD